MSALPKPLPDPASDVPSPAGRLRGFLSTAREIDDAPVRVAGTLPEWLRGTLQLNGPALWELPGGTLRHWFDGYAMWHRITLGAADARYRSRFAASESYRRSVAAGAPVYGEFGSPNPAGFLSRLLKPQFTDNPAVVMSPWGDRWISVTETPVVTVFDPDTLATGERIELGSPREPLHLMSAHGATLADGSYLNVGIALGARCEIKLFKLAPGARRPDILARIKTARAGYTHAIALADGHALVWETALRAQALTMRFSARAYADCYRWEPAGGSMVHAIALADGRVRSWAIPPMMAFHATQAFVDGDELVLDLGIYDDPRVFDDLRLDLRRSGAPLRAQVRHVRYRLRPGHAQAEPERLPGPAIELQQIHPRCFGRRRARYCWGAGLENVFNNATHRIDLEAGTSITWQRPDAVQLEPLFVPRPGAADEDDGVLLVPTLADGDEATVVAVLDAAALQPLAQLHLPQIVPFGFHAAFRPA